MEFVNNISMVTIFFLVVAVVILFFIFSLIRKARIEKIERAWMEDKLKTNKNDDFDDGEILDNGDYVSKARFVTENQEEPKSKSAKSDDKKKQEKYEEHTIGDIDIALEDEVEVQTKQDLTVNEDTEENIDLSDYKVAKSTDDKASYDKYHKEIIKKASDYSGDDGLNSPHHTMVALSVMAEENEFFEGPDILRDFNFHEMEYHKQTGLYCHAMPGFPDKQLFCVASVLKPGLFKPDQMYDFKTKGLLIFMSLPNPLEPTVGFEQMYQVAKRIAINLGGKLCDSMLHELSDYRLAQIREDMQDLELKLKIEAKKAAQQ